MQSYQNVKSSWSVILPWLPRLFAAILLSLLLGGAAAQSAPAFSARATVTQDPVGAGCQPWELVSPPSPRTHQYLNGIDALAPDDIWAVGEYYDVNNFTPDTTLAMHWAAPVAGGVSDTSSDTEYCEYKVGVRESGQYKLRPYRVGDVLNTINL